MKQQLVFGLALCLVILAGCSKDKNTAVDTEYPVIDISGADAFPIQCSELRKGETIRFVCDFSDNVELGSFSLDFHNNFDHHTHSTEVNDCATDPVKTPVKPFLFLKSYPFPANSKSYKAGVEIAIPGDIDAGDYHLMIMLTDKEGWQSIKGLSIKIK
jgi:hypothetical protein